MRGVRIDPASVETNIVIFDLEDPTQLAAPELARRAASEGVRVAASSASRIRAVTHLDVGATGIDRALAVIEQALATS